MNKEEYNKLFIGAIKTSDPALIGEISIDSENIETEEDYDIPVAPEDLGIYFRYKYSIDDRIERMNDEVVKSIKKLIGDDYGVSIDRLDAYPDGTAYYAITIDK